MLLALPSCADGQVATGTVAVASVDTARLMNDMRVLSADSMEGRAAGSAGSAKARVYLLRRFAQAGLEPFGQSFERTFAFSGRGAAERRGVNLVGFIRGRSRPDRYLVLTAHYDHLGVRNGTIYNGADDNASGTAALLVLADHFRRNPPEHSIIIAALDAEEIGLRGARAFVDSPLVDGSAILANVNLDMVSRNDAGELWVAGTYHYPRLRPLVDEVALRAPVKLRAGHDRPGIAGQDDWTSQSDHGAFHAARIPFLYLGVEDHADYHRPTDDAERIEPAFFGAAVATAIEIVRRLDEHFR